MNHFGKCDFDINPTLNLTLDKIQFDVCMAIFDMDWLDLGHCTEMKNLVSSMDLMLKNKSDTDWSTLQWSRKLVFMWKIGRIFRFILPKHEQFFIRIQNTREVEIDN